MRLKSAFRLFVNRTFAKATITEYILLLSIVAFSLLFSLYGIQKYEYYRTGFGDFGQRVQIAWLVSKGHVTAWALGRPILIVLGVPFALYPYPATLLILQSSLLALGALPLYRIARRELKNRWHALIISILYLIYPALGGVNQYEYHDEAIMIPFMIFAFYFYSTKRTKSYLISLLFGLFSSSFVVLIGAFLALSFLIDYSESKSKTSIRFAALTVCLILAWAVYLELTPFIPQFQLSTLPVRGYTLVGSSTFIDPLIIIRNPIQFISESWSDKVQFLIYLFAPVIFLPLLSLRRLLPAFPWLAVVITNGAQITVHGVFQLWHVFTSFVIPFVFVSTIYGLKQFTLVANDPEVASRRLRQMLVLMLIISVVVYSGTGVFSPFSPVRVLSWGDTTAPIDVTCSDINAICQTELPYHGIWPTPVANYTVLNWFVSQIPDNYSVLTQNQIGSKLWERAVPIYVFYQPGYDSAYLLKYQPDAIIVDYSLAALCSSCLTEMLATGNYTLYASYVQSGIYLYFKSSTYLGSRSVQANAAYPSALSGILDG